MKLLVWWIGQALALGVAVWLVDGLRIVGRSDGDRVVTLVFVALIVGAINAVVAPAVKLLSLPFILLTLGLLLLVINGLMLLVAEQVAGLVDLGFRVDGLWSAILGAIVMTLAGWVLKLVLPDPDKR